MMQVIEPPKALLDFENKTIQFKGAFKLSDIKLIQESLVNQEEWRVVTEPNATITYTPWTGIGTVIDSGNITY